MGHTNVLTPIVLDADAAAFVHATAFDHSPSFSLFASRFRLAPQPIMQRIQDALTKQLLESNERVAKDLGDKVRDI